jgi:hypothetical protein
MWPKSSFIIEFQNRGVLCTIVGVTFCGLSRRFENLKFICGEIFIIQEVLNALSSFKLLKFLNFQLNFILNF